MFLLGYDIGSSSVKASLVNAETGKCVSSAFFPKTEAKIIAVNPGWAEQDPESWWENLKLSTQAIMAESGVSAAEIKAIGISYQMHGISKYYVLLLSGVILVRYLLGSKHLKQSERRDAFLIC